MLVSKLALMVKVSFVQTAILAMLVLFTPDLVKKPLVDAIIVIVFALIHNHRSVSHADRIFSFHRRSC